MQKRELPSPHETGRKLFKTVRKVKKCKKVSECSKPSRKSRNPIKSAGSLTTKVTKLLEKWQNVSFRVIKMIHF